MNNELTTYNESYIQEPSNSIKTLGSTAVGKKSTSSESWMSEARCRDLNPDIFFPEDGSGVAVAKAYCGECSVKGACLNYALDNHIDHGVWGGTSERQRRRLQRLRRINNYPISSNGHISQKDD
jgi:WhiB family redox-sensing transcriptional regulator